jgi:hypothetical protein
VARVDSVYIETLKEILIPLPGDTIEIDVFLDCPDQDVAVIETNKLKQTISILNKRLQSITTIKPDTVIIYIPEIREKIVIEKKPVEVRYVPRWIKFLSWVGIAAVLVVVALIGLKMRNVTKVFKKILGS